MVNRTEADFDGSTEKEKRRNRIDTLTNALGVIAAVENRQKTISTAENKTPPSQERAKQAGEALAEVLMASPVAEPILFEMVEQVYGIDTQDLTTKYFELIRTGIIKREGLGFSRGDRSASSNLE